MKQEAISLFDGVRIGDLELGNRIVMAPMTRSRAGEGDAPTALATEYYRQRAGAGLIVSEGAQPSPHGKGYCRTPGIYSARQVTAWKQVTEALHGGGGRISLQITHGGRIGHPLNKEPGSEALAPSAIQAKGQVFTDQEGMVDFAMPRALDLEEIPGVIEEFRQATQNALLAGFDAVELHSASGYLPMQFLSTGTNRRTDGYGGAVANRIRFVVEVLEAMASVDGASRVGLRICPGTRFNDICDENAMAREHFGGPLIVNDGFDFETGQEFVGSGRADLVSYGRFFISNPDLVRRFREGAPLADFDRNTLYTPGPKGYIDYPALA